jgi:hypothetical protein
MPIFLQPKNNASSLYGFKSVLIVTCPVCPAVSLAIQQKKPYMELLRHFLATGALREQVAGLKADLEQRGIRTGTFTSYLPLPLMCLWSAGQRRRLLRKARGYQAIAILGCDAATVNARDALVSLGCEIVQMMQVAGIVTAIPAFEQGLDLKLNTIGKDCVVWPALPAAAADPRPLDPQARV